MRCLAKQAKLDPDRDIAMTAIPTGDSMPAALKIGRIDGFANETRPEKPSPEAVKSAWTNDDAAKALASMKRP